MSMQQQNTTTKATQVSQLWAQVCHAALAKLLSELTYEEVLAPVLTGAERFELQLACGVYYTFQAQTMAWGNLWVEPESIARHGDTDMPVSPLQFAIDAQTELAMKPETLATFLREMSNTLRQDLHLARTNGGLDAEQLLQLKSHELHTLLEGHPKAVANKGRLGWGAEDTARFAPEARQPLTLIWLAALRENCELSHREVNEERRFLKEALGKAESERLFAAFAEKGVDFENYCVIPVHPWQWDHVIQQTHVHDLHTGKLIELGTFGGRYVSGPSLRTLTSVDRPGSPDVKVALMILNTSAWRGIPGKYITNGSALSNWLHGIVQEDDQLKDTVLILREQRGVWYRHPFYDQLSNIPYQHNESLGAIWRENASGRVGANKVAHLYAALLHMDNAGVPLAARHAQKTGMALSEWIRRLFEVTVVPLYHMLCVYGVGFIAHGQNITVVLENHIPTGMAIKDLQGDVDLVNQVYPEQCDLSDDLRALLPAKPAAYIVHDIQTAHFITVLRFLSSALQNAEQMHESDFYQILGATLKDYMAQHPQYEARFKTFELFAPTIPRVCINKVRFQIGYGDNAERPLPALGTDLKNPLVGG
ncbi:Aerobactin synthase [Pseudovibrio axinellae]|uniref:Aerobactin synthase n=1 Tax=Pseudovibrio axinellae TaxID=989403 RepID=A0A165UPJ3_9HYPH|nr:IucA/IucC family protein [Pseudovibrio axinellae]KZL12661.1 Aerobactin synthase [Pseudovibrio axinellae]SEP62526.1 aerobactin synthase [Pseudovibrio axinellae]